MAKFKEKNISGVIFDRLSVGVINIPKQGDPKFTFQQTRWLDAGVDSTELPANTFTVNYNKNQTIDLRDPVTNDLLNKQITQEELVAAIYGLYVASAP
jgi:hypothetical protein